MKQIKSSILYTILILSSSFHSRVESSTIKQGVGHSIQKRATSMCGQVQTFTLSSGSTENIASPGHPNPYPAGCTYQHTFKTTEVNKVIQIKFTEYDMTNDIDGNVCFYAYLTLKDVGFSNGLDQHVTPSAPDLNKWWLLTCVKLDMSQADYGTNTFFSNEARLIFNVESNDPNPATGYNGIVTLRDKVLLDFGDVFGDSLMYGGIVEDKSVSLNTPNFQFYGQTYSSIFISENGVISFDQPFVDNQGFGLENLQPLDQYTHPLIAPYKADASVQRGDDGQVFYRIEENELDDINTIIEEAFCNEFDGDFAIIVTYFRMPFFSSQLDGLRLRNSYQVIIVGQHGGDTYIIYNFHEVTWYSGGGNSGGNIHTGQGGQPAMAGFTDGLGSSFELPYSGTNDVIRIDDESNVGMAGRYVFRVNGASIVEPDSPTSPILTCPSSPAPVLNCGSGEFIPATVAWSDPTTVTCLPLTSPISCTPSSPHTFTATTTVSCSASNAVGEGTCTFDVLVNQDTTAPTIICTEDITTQSNNPLGTQVAYSPPMSEDECGVYTSCDLPSNSLFPCGENTVTCTSMDNVGNQNSCSFKITVNCQQLQLTNCPSNIDVVDSMPYGEAVNWDPPTASGHTSLTSNYEPGHVFFGGTFDVVYTATDAAGNELQCTFTITVESDVYGPVSSLCRKYLLDTTSKTWNESDTSCQSSGGNLARIVGQKTNNFLITSIQDQGMNPSDIWFGAHRVESSWLYPDDSPVCYSNWASGEDQDGDTCAQLWAQPSGKWTSEDCSLTKRSICELA